MKYSNKSFPKALKEIMEKKDIVHRKLAAKTNFSFSYFCVLKKRKKHPPVETIKKIASGLGIPPEYFLEYRIDKLIKLLMDNPSVTDDVFECQETAKKVIEEIESCYKQFMELSDPLKRLETANNLFGNAMDHFYNSSIYLKKFIETALLPVRILPKFFTAAARTNFHGQNLLYYQGIVNVLRAILFYNYLKNKIN